LGLGAGVDVRIFFSAYHPEMDYFEDSTPVNQILHLYTRNILRITVFLEEPGSAVGIATTYGLDD
jgi:hypothetical protein